jgi:lipopolysaccharide transport system permease protein
MSYRHLLASLVKREFLLNYQQTVLGPLWILLQPILTLIIYVMVFGKFIGIPIGDNLPPVLFYFSGIVLWNFFNDSFSGTSNTFRDNIHIFSKVYFPRIIMPLSQIGTHLFRMFIQLVLLALMIVYYSMFTTFQFEFTWLTLMIPVAIFFVGLISFSMGLMFSVLTAKYRDLGNLVFVGIRLLMFVTPVIYPLATVKESLRWIVNINPLTPLFELFKLGLLGEGTVSMYQFIYSVIFAAAAFWVAIILFQRQGSKLIDYV